MQAKPVSHIYINFLVRLSLSLSLSDPLRLFLNFTYLLTYLPHGRTTYPEGLSKNSNSPPIRKPDYRMSTYTSRLKNQTMITQSISLGAIMSTLCRVKQRQKQSWSCHTILQSILLPVVHMMLLLLLLFLFSLMTLHWNIVKFYGEDNGDNMRRTTSSTALAPLYLLVPVRKKASRCV